ncbi:MAG: tRNA lysidine(34) synthetase TilS [Acidobacteriota bacterium]
MARSELFLKVLRLILAEKMFSATDRVLVALSGGPDSVALVALLEEIRLRRWPALEIHLAHLNHQLRNAESERDEAFVRQLAAQWSLPIIVERIAVAKEATQRGENLEATARQLRYRFLQRVAKQISAYCIATGHTMNDQAETVLMRLLRGAGPTGLVGIYPVLEPGRQSELAWLETKVVRPLLGLRRDEIEYYLAARQLATCQDSSNLACDFTRNKIRWEILPRLQEINPRAVEAIARAAQLLREETFFASVSSITSGEQLLSVQILNKHLPAMRRRLLREAIGCVRGGLQRISAAHLAAVESLLAIGKSGKRVELPGGYEAIREFDTLLIRPVRTIDKKEKIEIEWILPLGGVWRRDHWELRFEPIDRAQIQAYIKDKMVAIVDLARTGERLRVRMRQPGDRYQPAGCLRIEKLKKLMIENKIPYSQRDSWPVVTMQSGELIWSPGLPLAGAFLAHATSERLAIILSNATTGHFANGLAK